MSSLMVTTLTSWGLERVRDLSTFSYQNKRTKNHALPRDSVIFMALQYLVLMAFHRRQFFCKIKGHILKCTTSTDQSKSKGK